MAELVEDEGMANQMDQILGFLKGAIAALGLLLASQAQAADCRIAVLGDSTIPGYSKVLKETELAAAAYHVQLQYTDILQSSDVESALQSAEKQRANGVLTMTSPVLFSHRARVASLAIKHHLPAIYHQSQYVEAGGLMSYGASFTDMDRRAAIYVDKILKGAKPAEMPVEQPTKFELVINLKTAKQMGLAVPPTVLAKADRVIK